MPLYTGASAAQGHPAGSLLRLGDSPQAKVSLNTCLLADVLVCELVWSPAKTARWLRCHKFGFEANEILLGFKRKFLLKSNFFNQQRGSPWVGGEMVLKNTSIKNTPGDQNSHWQLKALHYQPRCKRSPLLGKLMGSLGS